jgi:hypothetical protein
MFINSFSRTMTFGYVNADGNSAANTLRKAKRMPELDLSRLI